MANIHPSKLSLSYILNSHDGPSPMEEDTDQEIDRVITPQDATPTWQSCRPSVNLPCKLPPFSHLAQHHHHFPQQPQQVEEESLPDYRFTFPLRRESTTTTTTPLPNIAFFQHPSYNNHNAEEEEENNSRQQDSMPISPAFASINAVSEFETETEKTRGKRANTAPAPASQKYRMKKFTQATSTGMPTNSKRQPPRKISAEQLSYLEKAFEEDRMPDTTTKMRISQQLNLSPQQVKIWFQNKRARMRRMERALNPNEEETQTGGITFHFFEGQDFIHEY